MTTTLAGLKTRLSDDAAAAAFGKGFAKGYFSQAFGALPKTEVDFLVFRLLIETGVLSQHAPIYELARNLNITPAKARNLLFQFQLRTMSEADVDDSIIIAVTTAKFSVDGQRLSFGIESPLIRSAIDARSKTKGVFAEISLSGDILSVPIGQLGDFFEAFLSEAQAKALVDRLRKAKVLEATDLRKALNAVGASIAKGAASGGGKVVAEDYVTDLMAFIGQTASGAAPELSKALGLLFTSI